MQIKRLAALSLAAIVTAAMLTGCPWDIEDDASSVTSSPGLTSIRVGTGIMNANATIDNGAFDGVPDDVIIYYPSELETNLEALKEKLKMQVWIPKIMSRKPRCSRLPLRRPAA